MVAPLFLCPHSTLADSVSLGPLSLGYIFLAFLLFLLFSVTCLNHLGQFPGQQSAGNEERCESKYDSGEETVGVFGSPLHHILCPCPNINHAVQQRRGLLKPEKGYQEKKHKESKKSEQCHMYKSISSNSQRTFKDFKSINKWHNVI